MTPRFITTGLPVATGVGEWLYPLFIHDRKYRSASELAAYHRERVSPSALTFAVTVTIAA